MQLLNQPLNGVSGLVADFSVGLNLDIFETNIVNLTLLVGGIFYLGSNALSESLTERQQRVLGSIQESEERLQQAVSKLAESETNLKQAQLVITSIKEEADATAKKVKSGILTDGKNEIERLTATAKSQISTIELKIRNQISEYVVSLALQRVTTQLEGKLGQGVQEQLIDKNISKL
jgi:F-type H+-transporting ATPase subunit b